MILTLDGSELAEEALPHAEAIAHALGVTLVVLHVVPCHFVDVAGLESECRKGQVLLQALSPRCKEPMGRPDGPLTTLRRRCDRKGRERGWPWSRYRDCEQNIALSKPGIRASAIPGGFVSTLA